MDRYGNFLLINLPCKSGISKCWVTYWMSHTEVQVTNPNPQLESRNQYAATFWRQWWSHPNCNWRTILLCCFDNLVWTSVIQNLVWWSRSKKSFISTGAAIVKTPSQLDWQWRSWQRLKRKIAETTKSLRLPFPRLPFQKLIQSLVRLQAVKFQPYISGA